MKAQLPKKKLNYSSCNSFFPTLLKSLLALGKWPNINVEH